MGEERPYDLMGNIIDYEDGSLSESDAVRLFSHLIATGDAWTLQGSYGRAAMAYIEQGVIDKSGKILIDLS